jgi:hypothetical protein
MAEQFLVKFTPGRVAFTFLLTMLLLLPVHAAPEPPLEEPETIFPPDIEPPLPPIPPLRNVRSAEHTDSFTDSQGRVLQYRYSIPDGLSTTSPEGVLLYFHGNNAMTQQEILDGFFPSVEWDAAPRNLIPVVVASPETRSDGVTRQWYDEDQLTIQEFLQSKFEGHFEPDFNRIYFAGGSQGTCFLHDFIMAYGENYGGGFFGGCGCFNSPDPLWEPSQAFKDRFKVYIHTTTEDFLYETSQRGYGYYEYTLGMNTRGDLDKSGSHCIASWAAQDTALDWFIGLTEIPDEDFAPHWERISTLDDIRGIALGSLGNIWIAQKSGEETVRIWSRAGTNQPWTIRNTISNSNFSSLHDLDYTNGDLLLTAGQHLYRSADGGLNFTLLDSAGNYRYQIATDLSGRLFRDGYPVRWSDDGGDSWTELDSVNDYQLSTATVISNPPRLLTIDYSSDLRYLVSPSDGLSSALGNTALGPILTGGWDGSTLWGLTQAAEDYSYRLFKSTNQGSNWSQVNAPAATETYYYYGAGVTALSEDKLILHGGFGSSWLSQDGGVNWSRIPGLGAVNYGEITISPDNEVYYTSGTAAFRLVEQEEELDTDGDGTPDSLDLDDDNDGLEDTEEAQLGTNPLLVDSDGDGQNDGDDLFPINANHCFSGLVTLPDVMLKSGSHAVESTGDIASATRFEIGSGVNVELLAGQRIFLNPGFRADQGSQLHAAIDAASCVIR